MEQISKFLKAFLMQHWLNPTIKHYSILDCSGIDGKYNNGTISITYDNGDLHVLIGNSDKINSGKVEPSCEGYVTFDYDTDEKFKFNEQDKEINWYSRYARIKWIKG